MSSAWRRTRASTPALEISIIDGKASPVIEEPN